MKVASFYYISPVFMSPGPVQRNNEQSKGAFIYIIWLMQCQYGAINVTKLNTCLGYRKEPLE